MESRGAIVIADFEAGLGALSRIERETLDRAIVVVEPTQKSIEVGRRALELIRGTTASAAIVLGNRVTGEADARLITQAFAGEALTLIPYDEMLRNAETTGLAPYDVAPEAPAVLALARLAQDLG